jgi:hypothetical protein
MDTSVPFRNPFSPEAISLLTLAPPVPMPQDGRQKAIDANNEKSFGIY